MASRWTFWVLPSSEQSPAAIDASVSCQHRSQRQVELIHLPVCSPLLNLGPAVLLQSSSALFLKVSFDPSVTCPFKPGPCHSCTSPGLNSKSVMDGKSLSCVKLLRLRSWTVMSPFEISGSVNSPLFKPKGRLYLQRVLRCS